MSTPTVHDHGPTGTTGRANRTGVLAGIGIAMACAVACALPLIAAGGLVAGVGAFLTGGEGIALGVVALVTALVAGALWVRRRRATAASRVGQTGCDTSCGCSGAC